MTVSSLHSTDSQATRRPSAFRRVFSLARYEALLIVRNKVMLFNAVALAPLFVGLIVAVNQGADFTPSIVIALMVPMAILFVVYLNLTSIFVARREDRVFARMETGEASKWEALAASAMPSVTIFLLQVVLAGTIGIFVFGGEVLYDVVGAVIGTLLVLVVFVSLAAATTAFTKSVEAAQITTLPIFAVMFLTSGVMFPVSVFPEVVQQLVAHTPLYALSGLIMGPGSVEAAIPALSVIAIWAALSLALARRYMRFAPRR